MAKSVHAKEAALGPPKRTLGTYIDVALLHQVTSEMDWISDDRD